MLLLIARLELTLALRSRWTQIFSIVFGGLAVAVAASGYVLSGGHGVQDFARTAASLVQLLLLLVPLTALVTGVLALTPERGAAEILFSQPLERQTILFGKLLGLWIALGAAQAIGFGAAGLIVFSQSGDEGAGSFLSLLVAGLVLTAVFLCVAALLSSTAAGRGRSRALALAVVVWFVSVLLVDLLALGLASGLPSGPASRVLILAALANPIGAVRTGALLVLDGTGAFGAASLALLRFTGGPKGLAAAILVSLGSWMALPLLAAVARLRRADV